MTETRTAFWRASLLAMLLVLPLTSAADEPLEATTEDGRKVILHPDGRWEFNAAAGTSAGSTATGAAPKAAAPTSGAAAGSGARSDDRYCQGGLFGVGRRVCPGDPEYNRGSLNPKLR
jgi:hypothetical protein